MYQDQNKNKNEFYYISMRDVLRKLHQMWGVSLSAQKEFIPDDIIRLFGLLFTDVDLKDNMLDLTGEAKI